MKGVDVIVDVLVARSDEVPTVVETMRLPFLKLRRRPKSVLQPGKNLAKVWCWAKSNSNVSVIPMLSPT